MSLRRFFASVVVVALAACGSDSGSTSTAQPGLIFTYPADHQVDVPTGARIVAAFSEPVAAGALGGCTASGGGFCVVGPDGPIAATADVGADGKTVEITAPDLDPGTKYDLYIGQALCPNAANLPPSGPVASFTTHSDRPRAAAPTLIAVNGGDPTMPESYRPMLDTSTIRLVFSEPLDPRSVTLASGSVELLDARGIEVKATVISQGVHVSIDPVDDLTGGETYQLRLGGNIVDLGGQPMQLVSIPLMPHSTHVMGGPYPQVLRTRMTGDPGAAATRTGGMTNAIVMQKPLIGTTTSAITPSMLASELADPTALGGPIAFRLRKGQRLHAAGVSFSLGGTIPTNVATGDIVIELVTDGGGRLYRNPHQSADQKPENDRAPLYVDLDMDVAIYSLDRSGNAVLSQTVLGVQGVGVATATDGVLDIESVTSMDLGLLGVTTAASNLTLELITDTSAQVQVDNQPPSLTASLPDAGSALLAVDGGIELIFDEPIDLDRARAGGIVLEDAGSNVVPSVIESHGASVVVRPLAPLAYSSTYQVVMTDVADVAGNRMAPGSPIQMSTPNMVSSTVPMTIASSHPGAPCALTAAASGSPGRCASSAGGDDMYQAFSLAANEDVILRFTAPLQRSSAVLGTTCNSGSVRVEQLDGSGACSATVPGTLMVHDREIRFVPDAPWTVGSQYRVTLISGTNQSCNAGEMCGLTAAASFDPLAGTTTSDGGGPNALFTFTGAPASQATFLIDEAAPASDQNGNGYLDGAEVTRDENRAALRITGTGGSVGSAHFNGNDCIASTPETEACIYLASALPVDMAPVQQNCSLPDGSTASSCLPLLISTHAFYGTSISMTASVGISITNDTGTTVMRVREPAGGGPLTGYIVTKGSGPVMIVALDLYMDAPDMSLPLGTTHDLHSKQLHIVLEGPVTTLEDGRIAINAANTADVPFSVNVDVPILGGGNIDMVIPQGEMKLQLLSPPLRGGAL